MTYEEFERQENLKWEKMRKEAQCRGDKAYNKGLWQAVKWSPSKWWIFLMYRRD